MTLGTIFRFEFGYQARRVSTWLYCVAVFFIAWSIIQGNYVDDARNGWTLINAPLIVASTTVVACLFWLFVGASVAGDAASRDIESGLHPLSYTAPVSKFHYLAGRFLAAYALNAMILLAVPAGMLLGMHWPDVEPEIVGPWRPDAFALAYVSIILPNVFIATAVQFAFAALGRRAILGYFGSVVLFFASMGLAAFVMTALREQDLARLLDPVGMISIVGNLYDTWTTTEKNTRLVGLQPILVGNRLLWLAVGAAVLAWTYARFRLAHPAEGKRRVRRMKARAKMHDEVSAASVAVRLAPIADRRFGLATQLRQLRAVTGRSLRTLATGWTVFPPLALVAFLVCVAVPARMEYLGVPLLPRTEHVLTYLTAALANPGNRVWMIVPLLIIFYAGELVWGERDARMGEISGAAPVPDWVFFVGKFLALALVLIGWMFVLATCGVIGQAVLGYAHFEMGLYAKVLFGLQLTDYLLFALLALTVHTVVNQKHLGTLAALALYALIAFAPLLGIEHKLLVFGASPEWSYSDIRGFGASLQPWLAFKAYWIAWALLLAVLARLAWVRGRESDLGARLQLARARWTRPTMGAAALAGIATVGLGAYIFYNTNVLNAYSTQEDRLASKAAYERLYARYADVPQPTLVASRMRVELYPRTHGADFRGSYRLVNATRQAIDTVHVATATGDGIDTRTLRFDRPATRVLEDAALGHQIYKLATPLQPGASMQLHYDVRFAPRGFGNRGADDSVVANGSWLQTANLLPTIGYQPRRELQEPGDRLTQGLPARPKFPLLEDTRPRNAAPGDVGIQFDAIVGTDDGQTAIAPGALRRSWRENGRRYFEYASNAPIREDVQFFSGDYAVHRTRCNGVGVEVVHHPTHTGIVADMARSACASLARYTQLFGPYPHRTMRIVENAARDIGAHAEPGLVDYGDGFSLLNPAGEPDGLNLVFAVTAHEVAHQWWGQKLAPARVEGAGLLVESLATYSATQVMESTLGPDQLQGYLDMMRGEYQVPRSRASPPLLRATEQFLNYRKGPLAIYALSQYIGRDNVNLALRRLLASHPPGHTPRATTLDLYREFEAVTPAQYRPLLHDLFAANTYWELSATQAKARKVGEGWQVTVDLRARKLLVDDAGEEIDRSLDEWIEIGVFPGEAGKQENGEVIPGKAMSLQKHRISKATQTITVTVPNEPGYVGIDPRALLVDVRPRDNFVDVGR
ncbi:putative membrane protein [Lysobacter dokdonensis DS-58]|uniref:Putative membrane protein n=1 Tax=Lysobacter dokdonensis DS-58 TaxID=1300345 RepID=A0A0A2X220_9GAMM|nr:M1 family aminopeptidase [Lysobacter dokdonensis]KGQ19254.1 putative membrane protein [Lysobacter dokdonensis DS-58]